MLVDLAADDGWEAPAGEAQAEVAIAGGGLAGLVLASRLAALGKRVIVLEAASAAEAAASQELYRAEQIGQPTLPADETRLRWLGGSSNHWGGWCRPLAPEDMASRPEAELPGWPFGPEALAPYLVPAATLLGLVPPPPAGEALAGSEGLLAPVSLGFSDPPFQAAEALLPGLAALPQVTLVLNAEVAGTVPDREAGRLAHFVVGRRYGQRLWRVPARLLVLAMGAMENLRFLLALQRTLEERLSALVGLGYMQHLHGRIGQLVRLTREPGPVLFDDGRPRFLETTAAFLARHGSRARLYAEPADCADPALGWLARLACATDGVAHLRATAEQWPSRSSRLLLGEGADWLGRPPLVIDWRPGAGDKARLRQAALAYGAWLARTGGWRLRLADWLLAEDAALPLPDGADGGDRGAAGHQMGGARTGLTPAAGVADPLGAVFGAGNLYLASTALFAGSGHAPPTLTLVQLTLRLADSLAARLGG